MTKNDEAPTLKAPLWTGVSTASWFVFEEEFRNYRAVGGLSPLERCVSVRSKLALKLEFNFERWQRDGKPSEKESADTTKKKKSPADEDAKTQALDPEDAKHEAEVLKFISQCFAPPNSFVAQSKFEKLRMSAPSLDALRSYNLSFAVLEKECAPVLPPPRILARIYAAGLTPSRIRHRVADQEFATWHLARVDALTIFKDVEALSHLMSTQMTLSPAPHATEPTPSKPAKRAGKDVPERPVMCFRCKEPGHIAKHCPIRPDKEVLAIAVADEEPHVSWPVVTEETPAVQAIVGVHEKKKKKKTKKTMFPSSSLARCFCCGDVGHISSMCPQARKFWSARRAIRAERSDDEDEKKYSSDDDDRGMTDDDDWRDCAYAPDLETCEYRPDIAIRRG
jgi:hypothetical protein